MRKTVQPFVIVAGIAACVAIAQTHQAVGKSTYTPKPAIIAGANDTARYLAGLAPTPGSQIAKLAASAHWRQHAKWFDAAWKRMGARQLNHVRAWSAKNITQHQPNMFYMFSGPDFLYAEAVFPKAKTYVLSGLEPVGRVPDLTKLSAGARAQGLNALRASLSTVMNISFFITKKMRVQFKSSKFTGTLPVLYVFIARAGKTIDNVTYITLTSDGEIAKAGDTIPSVRANGVKIDFHGSDGMKQTVYYFSTNIANSLVGKSGFLKFCEKLGASDSLIKSSSYHMHEANFSKIRDIVLNQSHTIVQDDTGVPLRMLKGDVWNLEAHGRYTGPIGIFTKFYQRDLARLFKTKSVGPIKFGFGYKWRVSNILVARRK